MKKTLSVLLFVVLATIVPLHAQRLPDLPKPKIASQTDLRKALAMETQKIKSQSATVDKKQMEKLSRQTAKRNWSNKQTLFLVLFAVGVAAIVFFVIKYGKECLRYRNNCDPAFEENCYCEEYAPRNRDDQNR